MSIKESKKMSDLMKKNTQNIVGIIIDSENLPKWINYSIIKILNSNDIKLIIKVPKVSENNSKLYKKFIEFEKNKTKEIPDSNQLIDCSEIFQNIPIIEVNNNLDKIKNQIHHYNLDVLINFCSYKFNEMFLESAKNGVWKLFLGEKNKIIEPFGFWEVINRNPITKCYLIENSKNNPKGKIIYESISRTDVLYTVRNQKNSFWKMTEFFERNLRKINTNIENSQFTEKLTNISLEKKYPNNFKMIQIWCSYFKRYLQIKFNDKFFSEQYQLGYNFTKNISKDIKKFRKIIPPEDRFWADPIVFKDKEKWYIFIEELPFSTEKGHISVFEISKDGKYTTPIKVLEEKFHLSYPFVFKYDNEHYMIPESAQANSIRLYKAENFPNKWKYVRTIIENVGAVDTTIFFHKNIWWLFTCFPKTNGANPSEELFLYYSDNPVTGTWLPHPKNPIISDVRSARPAGKIILKDKEILRPSQDAHKGFGHAIKINRITKLTKDDYQEEVIDSIEPDWDGNVKAIHTLDLEQGLMFIDFKKKKLRTK